VPLLSSTRAACRIASRSAQPRRTDDGDVPWPATNPNNLWLFLSDVV